MFYHAREVIIGREGYTLSAGTSGEAPWPPAVRWALRTTVLGIAVYIVLDIVAQLLPPHYSAIRQAESDLGVGRYGWVMDVNFVVRGALSLALAYGLYRAWPKNSKVPKLSLALIGAWGIGAFVLALNPADVSGPATLHGTIHVLTGLLAFLFVTVGILGVSRSMPDPYPWGWVGPYARGIALCTAIALVVLFVGTRFPPVEQNLYGLLERVFLGLALLWMLVVSIQLLRSNPFVGRASASPM